MSLDLPSPTEKIEHVDLHRDDQKLYDLLKKKTAAIAARQSQGKERIADHQGAREVNILTLMNFLRRICNHGKDLLPSTLLTSLKGLEEASINCKMVRASLRACKACGEDLEVPGVDRLDSMSPEASPHQYVCAVCNPIAEDNALEDQRLCLPDRAISQTSPGKLVELKPAVGIARPSAKVESLLLNLSTEQAACDPEKPVKRSVVSNSMIL